MEGARVVVVVVSRDERHRLAACLDALQGEPDAEVWVVDDASGDGSPAMVRERFPAARLIVRERPRGFASGFALAAARTESEWLAPVRAGAQPRPGALAALVATGRTDPDAAVIAPRLLAPDGAVRRTVHRFPPARPLARPSRDPVRAGRVPWAEGGLVLVRRAAWEGLGGYDPALPGAEELDLSWRLARQSWWTRCEPAAVVIAGEEPATPEATYEWLARRRGRAAALLHGAVRLGAAGLRGDRRAATGHARAAAACLR